MTTISAVPFGLSGRGKLLSSTALGSGTLAALAAAAVMLAAPPAQANPEGGQVVRGQASITAPGAKELEVRQASDRAVINWKSFSIAEGEVTRFRQPSEGSVTLNRVTGAGDRPPLSKIAGRLEANGNVMLVNPSGVVFTESARIDVGGLVATTSDLDDDHFMTTTEPFRLVPGGDPDAVVRNEGMITVAEGGIAALVAPYVANSGTIQARLGRVVMASGEAATLDLYGDGLIQFQTGAPAPTTGGAAPAGIDAQVTQDGAIIADGGTVLLSVDQARDVVDHAINMSGVIEARSVSSGADGRIVLHGGNDGAVRLAGRLDASGADQASTGGEVAVAGRRIDVETGAMVDVSGPAGGGQALIGGGVKGAPIPLVKPAVALAEADLPPTPELKPAESVSVAADARIDADATVDGDGGTIVAWADGTTVFDGIATARGGPEGGDGGFVETSGLGELGVGDAIIDASAPQGAAGEWLLDPVNVFINPNVTLNVDGTTDPVLFVGADTISFALNAGMDVTITTIGTAPTPAEELDFILGSAAPNIEGNISVNAPINVLQASDATLRLIADGDIDVEASIGFPGQASPSGGPDIILQSLGDGDITIATQDVQIVAENITITTNDGDVEIAGNSQLPGLVSSGLISIKVGGTAVSSEEDGGIQLNSFAIDGNDVSLVAEGIALGDAVGGIALLDNAIDASGNVDVAVRATVEAGLATILAGEDAIAAGGNVEITLDAFGPGEVLVLFEDGAVSAGGNVTISSSDQFAPGFFGIGEGLSISQAQQANNSPEVQSGGDVTIVARRLGSTPIGSSAVPIEVAGTGPGDATLSITSRGVGQRSIVVADVGNESAFDEVDLTLAGDFTLSLDLEGNDDIDFTADGFSTLTTAENNIDVTIEQENDDVFLIGSTNTGSGDLTITAAGGIDGSRDGNAPAEQIQGGAVFLTSTSPNVGISLDNVSAGSLTTNSAGTFLQNDVMTEASQRYEGRTIVVGPRVLTSRDGEIRFAGTVEAGIRPFDLGVAIQGPDSLLVQAQNVIFEQAVGGLQPLPALTVSGVSNENAAIELSDVTTDGNQAYFGDVTLNSTFLTNGGDFTVNGAITLAADLTTIDVTSTSDDGTTSGDISFGGPVDGAAPLANDLTLIVGPEGDITFAAPVGASVPPGTLTRRRVGGQPGALVLDVTDTNGPEDAGRDPETDPIDLAIAVDGEPAGSDPEIVIGSIPDGAEVLVDGSPANDGDSATVLESDLDGLAFRPTPDSDVDVGLSVTASVADGGGGFAPLPGGSNVGTLIDQGAGTASAVATLTIELQAVADPPLLSTPDEIEAVPGVETAVEITAQSTDVDGSERVEVTLSNLPPGTIVRVDGTAIDPVDGRFMIAAEDLQGLTVELVDAPAQPVAVDVVAAAIELAEVVDPATTGATFEVVPITEGQVRVTATSPGGPENLPIVLLIEVTTDLEGAPVITVSNVPDDATLSAGTNQGGGVWELDEADLAALTITPPANDSMDLSLLVEAAVLAGQATLTTDQPVPLPVPVLATTDPISLQTPDALTVRAGSAEPVGVRVTSDGTDESEQVTAVFSGLPPGASLSEGTIRDDGVVVPGEALDDLTVTAPRNGPASFPLTVAVSAQDQDPETGPVEPVVLAPRTFEVTVAGQARRDEIDEADAVKDRTKSSQDPTCLIGCGRPARPIDPTPAPEVRLVPADLPPAEPVDPAEVAPEAGPDRTPEEEVRLVPVPPLAEAADFDDAASEADPDRTIETEDGPTEVLAREEGVPEEEALVLVAAPTGSSGGPEVTVDEEEAAMIELEQIEACPDVALPTVAWQNTATESAFNIDPQLVPYSVDVFCAGYKLARPGRGTLENYRGMTFVLKDFWTDLDQARMAVALEPLRREFGSELIE